MSIDPAEELGVEEVGEEETASEDAGAADASIEDADEGKFWCPHCRRLHPAFMTQCPETGTAIDAVFKMRGSVLEGKYEVGRMIAHGGMGVVYQGTHTTIGRKLAIKFLQKSTTAKPQVLRRFQNEARMAASVGHRNIVDILDMGSTGQNIPYIVMEFLEGSDLGRILEAAVRLPVPLCIDFTMQIISALRAVHEKGIIHRDLKPENVFVVKESGGSLTLKIVDFGVSRLGGDDARHLDLTRTGAVFGTPRYMSPEQARGNKDIDARADLYSAGVMLYRMLTGVTPFDADDYNNLIIAITTEDPIHVAKHGVPIPDALGDVVMKAIARDPDDRWQTGEEFMQALLASREEESSSSELAIPDSMLSLLGVQSIDGNTPSVRLLTPSGSVGTGTGGSRTDRTGPSGSGVVSSSAHDARTVAGWEGSVDRTAVSGESPPPRRSRILVIASTVLVLLAVAGGIAAFVAWKIRSMEEQMTALATPPPVVEAPPEESQEPAEPTRWKLSLGDLPDGAEVYVDGALHPERPVLVKDRAGPRRVEIVSAGFEKWSKEVAVHADVTMSVRLTPIPPEPMEEEQPTTKKVKKPKKDSTEKKSPKPSDESKPAKKKKIDTVYPGLG